MILDRLEFYHIKAKRRVAHSGNDHLISTIGDITYSIVSFGNKGFTIFYPFPQQNQERVIFDDWKDILRFLNRRNVNVDDEVRIKGKPGKFRIDKIRESSLGVSVELEGYEEPLDILDIIKYD